MTICYLASIVQTLLSFLYFHYRSIRICELYYKFKKKIGTLFVPRKDYFYVKGLYQKPAQPRVAAYYRK